MTDAALLRAAFQKAGSRQALASLPQMPDNVTLWRWARAGRISTDRQRAILLQYLGIGETPEAVERSA